MTSFKCSLLWSLAMVCVCTALVHPADPFDANEDAQKVRQALIDSKEGVLSDLLARRTGTQRVAIAQAYNALYKRNLVEDFESELSGDFEDLMVAMVTPLEEYYAKELFKDAFPYTPDSRAVVDILCTSSNDLLRKIDEAYKRLELNTRIGLSGVLGIVYQGLAGRVIHAALEGKRHENQEVDEKAAIADAKVIHQLGERKTGFLRTFNDDRKIEEIFITRSVRQMQKIFSVYENLHGHGIEKAFKGRGFNSDLETGFLNMIKVFRSIPNYYAERLYDAVHGPGTNDRVLMRIIVGRSEIDLDKIKDAYQKLYGGSLAAAVEDDTSGEYGRALLHMIKA